MRNVVMIGCLVAAWACGDDDGDTGTGAVDMSMATDTGAAGCLSGTADSPIGGACGCLMDCVPGTVCEPESGAGGPMGVCSALCTPDGGECGADAVCEIVLAAGDQGLCRQGCTAHSECRDGWACSYGTCGPHCTQDSQCLSGACDSYWNNCNPSPNPDGGGVLAECTRDDQCRSTVCLTAIGGHCLSFCRTDADDCPDEAECVAGIDGNDPTVAALITNIWFSIARAWAQYRTLIKPWRSSV